MQTQTCRQALSELAKEPTAFRHHTVIFSGYVLAKAGHKKEALGVLRQIETQGDPQHRDYYLAIICLALGDKDQAFARLESARQGYDPYMAYFRSDIKLEGLRSDPRYVELYRRMNMPS